MTDEARDARTGPVGGRRPGVAEHLSALDVAMAGEVVDIVEVACDMATTRLAVCVSVARTSRSDAVQRVGLVDENGSFRLLDLPYDSVRGPAWSSSGQSLAVVATRPDGSSDVVELTAASGFGTPNRTWAVDGLVERIEWCPGSLELAVLVASPGAEISDVHGSGTVGGAVSGWQPRVLPGQDGRRTLLTTAHPDGLTAVSDINVWEFAWAGADRFVAVVSEQAGEGAWYDAEVAEITVDGGIRTLHLPVRQVACPRVDPVSQRWSVIEAMASDRGVLAGTIMVGDLEGVVHPVDTGDVDVTDHCWSADGMTFVGVRGLDTAVGRTTPDARTADVTWIGPEACGRYVPAVAVDVTGTPLLVLEDHVRPPRLVALATDGARDLMATETAGSLAACRSVTTLERVSWTGADGWTVQGLLALPTAEGPHPLVVNVHGGPIAAWRNSWQGRDPHSTALVAAGYAVLKPNPRGSFGRGPAFAEAVVNDMGGLDALDILAGIRAVSTRPEIDGARIGITGNSYGGFMATWLPTMSDVFRASVARSPVTDWLTQHLTSNIAAFDEAFLEGRPQDPTSQYRTRSPLQHVATNVVPTMLTAGALDLATPASQAQLLYTALRENGVPAALVIYPEEGHGVRQRDALMDQCSRLVAWFDQHLTD